MSIRFAAAAKPGGSPACSPIARAMVLRAVERVANDNPPPAGSENDPSSDQLLSAALRHFAQHGMGAAREARSQALKAFGEGEKQAYQWWLGITRTLDRRMAREVERLARG